MDEATLEKRAASYYRAQEHTMDVHNEIVLGMESRTRPEYYTEPGFEQSAWDIARKGLFMVRMGPRALITLTRLLVTQIRFADAYEEIHPDNPLSDEELAELSEQLAT